MNAFFRTLVLALLTSTLPFSAVAATLGVTPAATSVHAGDIVTVRLIANTQGTAINQGEGTLQFPTDMLDVVSASKTGSIFTLWVEEPAYSNTGGTVHFDGGVPTPGFTGSTGTVLTITFHAKKAGTATIALRDAALRANDGLGTNVLSGTSGGTITIGATVVTPPLTPAPAPSTKPTASGSGAILALTSPTHSDENAWYQNANPLLSWQLPAGATEVQTIISSSSNATPSVSYKPAIVEKRVTGLEDGVSYFSVRAKTAAGWGPIASFRLQIDSEAPDIGSASFTYDADARVLLISAASASNPSDDHNLVIADISASDATSGVDRFELSIDGETSTAIPTETFHSGLYKFPYDKSGTHVATLSAIDRAGNHAEISGTFSVPSSLVDQTLWNIGGFKVTFGGFILFILLISVLALVAAGTAWYKLYRLRVGAKSRIEKRDKTLHRSLRIYKEELERHLRTLEHAGSKRELTDEEADLNEDLRKNVDDLERYLAKEFKKYD